MKTDSQILNATIQYLSELPKYLMNCFSSVLHTMKGYQRNVLLNAVPVLILSKFLYLSNSIVRLAFFSWQYILVPGISHLYITFVACRHNFM